MILIGQYDSPFVRRVGIALTLYGIAFEHRPWSAWGDAEKLRPLNPLLRVPTLVLADGDVLVDSHAMLDHLDSLVAPGRAMFPRSEPERRRALRIAMLAAGVGDKAVSLFYEQRLHAVASDVWVARCRSQLTDTLAALDSAYAASRGAYWSGGNIGHADIAVACVLRFLDEAHAGLFTADHFPALRALAARLEATPAFQAIQQRFIAPA